MRTIASLALPLVVASYFALGDVQPAAAQSSESTELAVGPTNMPRLLATASLGLPVRLRRDRRLGQSRLAPAYLDAFASFLFPNEGGWQHGVGLTASLGLTQDGGYFEPVDALSQILIAPTYVLLTNLNADWLAFGHAAIPIAVAGGKTLGVDVGASLAYRMLAGVGIFAEISGVMFVGLEHRLYPMVAAEIGAFVDYEVLP